ncbi:MAG: cell wall metabolism sensor histidine kinase WalK [Oscillospiraceae bacterium]|nr:cell wall metabolism sensor histidine kinase WalK [Oscillospiraceae bacterium]
MKRYIFSGVFSTILLTSLIFIIVFAGAFPEIRGDIIPWAFICIMLSLGNLPLLFTRRIMRKIAGLINGFCIDTPPGETECEELIPIARLIGRQEQEFQEQLEALKSRADTISVITENMREGLILINSNGIVLSVNKVLSDVFGDIKQQNILHICRDLNFQQNVRQCLSGINSEIVFEWAGKTYNVHFDPVAMAEEISGAVILFVDVTERLKAERQRREFSANVSHELKTPLTSISALAEMIESGMAKKQDITGFAKKISAQTRGLIEIINDIIKLSEFDEGKADKGGIPFSLYALAQGVVDALKDNERGVKIHLSGESFTVSANRRMIEELLYNLIENGVKYNQDGGSVTIELSRENGMCKIAVSDTGIGIPEEHHDRVFERFYRADKSRSKKTGGTGLGLSIVRHTAEHHGGRVEIESSQGAGTTVICFLAIM